MSNVRLLEERRMKFGNTAIPEFVHDASDQSLEGGL